MTEPRLPTMEEMKEIVRVETLLKVAHIEDEEAGEFSSCFIGHPCSTLSSPPDISKQLKYATGKVTTVPSESEGIFCYPEEQVDIAQKHAADKLNIVIQPPCVVLEVKPLGKLTSYGRPMSVYVVGVLKEKEKYVNPFKVGDRVRLVSSFKAGDYCMGCVKAGDVGQVVVVGTSQHSPQVNFSNIPIKYHVPEKYLELAPEPKEEWVDVTREIECKVERGEYIVLSHRGVELGIIGILPLAPLTDWYKVEPTRKGFSPEIQCARILKRELR